MGRRVGAGLATSASKAAHTTCLQCAISRGSAAVFGPRSVRRHVAAMTVALSTIQNAVVASSMPRSLLVTLPDLFAVVQHCAVPTCQRRLMARRQRRLMAQQARRLQSSSALLVRHGFFETSFTRMISSKERGARFIFCVRKPIQIWFVQ